jgi:hypothetical protein
MHSEALKYRVGMSINNKSEPGANTSIDTDKDDQEADFKRFRLSKPWLSGGLVSLGTLPLHFSLPEAASIQVSAMFLSLIAGVYVGFAVQDGRSRLIALEGCVALLFVLAAGLGALIWQWAIPLAYVFHGLWDWAHVQLVKTDAPRWYLPFCAAYDFAVAAGLIWAWSIHP